MSKKDIVAVHCNLVNARFGCGEKIGKYWYDYTGIYRDVFDDYSVPIVVHDNSIMGGMIYSIEPLWTAKYLGGPELSSQLLQDIFKRSTFRPYGYDYRSESRDRQNKGYIVTLFDTNSNETMMSIVGPHGSTLYTIK